MYYTSCAPGYKSKRRNFNKAYFKSTRPSANVIKNEDGFTIQLALAGFTKEDIAIEIDDHILKIKSVVKTEDIKSDNVNYRLREFDYAGFERSFTLSEDLDQDRISASMDEGILNINIPFSPVEPAKTISIH